ncbi:hypothetical protein V6N11_034058 [Hibiscus sabdariffa]|uniref:Uncharacterized protein n=1 Tax=Hibiscus sabdariffa TaxID=183260 RepID=A0ABR2S197_9ROSI
MVTKSGQWNLPLLIERWLDLQLFSSKLAYDNLARSVDWVSNGDWNVIWRKDIPQRICAFLWLARSGRLLTNCERVCRHLASSPLCLLCRNGEETILHALWDCLLASNVWSQVIRPSKFLEFMSLPFEEWFMVNLWGQGQFVDDPELWECLFPTIGWLLWKRCSVIKDPGFFKEGDVLMGDWVKANGDSACAIGSSKETAGCVVRDASGGWIFGFTQNLGVCPSILVEACVVHNILLHLCRLGCRLVELKTNCVEVEKILHGDSGVLSGNAIVEDIHEMLSRDLIVVIHKISRDSNKLVDALAGSMRDGPVGV